ncbi:DUF397 domain-containing protein [Actinomadura geliboluensis]|uniref:DUF397 domain-containing protein n=1 Tax=Actinomadura geliboluensis TaxID=882440 RepID=A0A5S4GXJ9_9ACTN|nr:DUF397 domain-containing protein [Actinomadura geliboluensis]TMR37567.1 DUF397 domain-containing protein [Actinomadura geliboluensis]
MTVQWRKSSHSGGANDATCVELAKLPTGIGIRDSKDPGGSPLIVLPAALRQALQRVTER